MERQTITKVPTATTRNRSVQRQSAGPSSPGHRLTELQRSIGNQATQRLINSHHIQAKLQVSTPGDQYEQEADRVADTVMRMHDPHSSSPAIIFNRTQISRLHRKCTECEEGVQRQPVDEEEEETVQAKSNDVQTLQRFPISARPTEATSTIFDEGMGSPGQPLDVKTRSFMEPRFGIDFSHVRVHTDRQAIEMNRAVSSQAFTHGSDIYYGAGHSPSNLDLTAHELTHVVQQTGRSIRAAMHSSAASGPKPLVQSNSAARIQRRLIVSGSSEALVNEYLGIVGGASGLRLNWTFAQPRVRVGGNLPGPVPSPSGRSDILRVINHATQNAELHIGINQPRVAVGAFPTAPSTIQTIDMDDIRNLNASLPGQGTAKALHEMMENFNAHGIGFGAFGASHAVGLEAESNVLEEQGIVGRRLGGGIPATVIPAPPGQPTGPNITYRRQLQNFTHYFLEIIQRVTTGAPGGPGADFQVVSARRIPKVQVSQRTIDGFASGSNAIPPAGNATLALVLADLNVNVNRTLLIEGFSDSRGSRAGNVTASRNRAASAQAFFIANGIAADRIAIVGRGETNFVATNANEAGRRQNRRIQLTVHRP